LKGDGCKELKYAIMEYLEQSREPLTADDAHAVTEMTKQA
jgi:hypothetical protein